MEETREEEDGAEMVSYQKPGCALIVPSAAAASVLRLGKKMVIAGAAIASAPLMIPPLIVGLAFALPFGVYYAGFAYTDSVMRALLTSPPISTSSIDERQDEEQGNDKEDEIEIWHPTPNLIYGDGSEAVGDDKLTKNGKSLGAETMKLASAVHSDDDEHSRALMEGGAGKETDSTFKGQTDEPSHVTSGHGIEMWPTTTDTNILNEGGDNMEWTGTGDDAHIKMVRNREPDICYVDEETEIKFEYTSIDGNDNDIKDIGMVQERPVQARRGAEENEEIGEREENNIEKGKINGKQEEAESPVYYPLLVNDYDQKGRVNMDGEKHTEVTGKVDEENAEELQEILGLTSVASKEEHHPTNIYSIPGLMPKVSSNNYKTDQTIFSSDNTTDWTTFSSKSASAVINGKETDMNEEKHPDMTMDGRQEGIEGMVQEASPADIEPHALLPAVHHSLPMVPEEREREFKHSGLRSENALPTSYDIGGGSINEVEGEFMTDTSIGEKKEEVEVIVNEHVGGCSINEVEGDVMEDPSLGGKKEENEAIVNEHEGTEMTQSTYVLTAVVSVACNSAIKLSAIEQNWDEAGIGTIISSSALEKEEEVMGERNIRGGCSAANLNSEEHLMTVYHSFGAVAPIKSDSAMDPSSLSTEYASALEDHSLDLTDADSVDAATTRETLGGVHSDDEVFYSEEIMWEQVHAIRTIIGYRDAIHPILADELKAICIFIGVEPPVSLEDASDIMQIGEMLKFLKWVIGVK